MSKTLRYVDNFDFPADFGFSGSSKGPALPRAHSAQMGQDAEYGDGSYVSRRRGGDVRMATGGEVLTNSASMPAPALRATYQDADYGDESARRSPRAPGRAPSATAPAAAKKAQARPAPRPSMKPVGMRADARREDGDAPPPADAGGMRADARREDPDMGPRSVRFATGDMPGDYADVPVYASGGDVRATRRVGRSQLHTVPTGDAGGDTTTYRGDTEWGPEEEVGTHPISLDKLYDKGGNGKEFGVFPGSRRQEPMQEMEDDGASAPAPAPFDQRWYDWKREPSGEPIGNYNAAKHEAWETDRDRSATGRIDAGEQGYADGGSTGGTDADGGPDGNGDDVTVAVFRAQGGAVPGKALGGMQDGAPGPAPGNAAMRSPTGQARGPAPTPSIPAPQAASAVRGAAMLGRVAGARQAMRGLQAVAPHGVGQPAAAAAPAAAAPVMAANGGFIQKAIKHPGRMQRAAARAGESTHQYMEGHKDAPGSLGAAARLGLRMTGGDLSPRKKKD